MNTFNKLTIQIDDTDIVEVMANVNTEHYIICATSIKKNWYGNGTCTQGALRHLIEMGPTVALLSTFETHSNSGPSNL
jgi:hypothetical protein